jgi:thioesterase domain-containing protein
LRDATDLTISQAGCIYDVRGILRDVSDFTTKYLSLGKCCDGTSMRVVDGATGADCLPYQEGQLQLRGPTVFREYFNNPQATMESFSDGWFITGDAAQLDSDGNLHLVGRDKDCVNINGVKHPSVDIEHYVEDLKIEGVMKSYLYACPMRLPDADTETYGIFYQHDIAVEGELSRVDANVIRSASRMIRAACVVFCSQAPHIILPLPRKSFVKTALGKISRSALAKAYLQGEYRAIQDLILASNQKELGTEDGPTNAVEQAVYDCVATIFGAKIPVNRSSSLFDLGASSMHFMQLKQQLQDRLSIPDLPTIDILRRPEIGRLCEYLVSLSAELSAGEAHREIAYSPLVCFNPTGSKPPLFLVHPGVGEVLVFINLSHVLADDRPVYALRARGFDAGQLPFSSFEEMVECYTSAIEKCYPTGPYFIAGYSFGGAVAFEIGKKLEQHGKRTAWLGILNLPPHIQFRMKELVWIEVLVNICMFLALIPTSAFASLKASLYRAYPELESSDAEPASSLEIIKWVFDHCDRERLSALQLNILDFNRWVGVAYELSLIGRDFQPSGRVSGALLTVFCAIPLPSMGTREEYKRDRLSGWRDFSSDRFEMVDVDGEHYTMLGEDHVNSFAEKLKTAMSRGERPLAPAPARALPQLKQDFNEVPIIDFSLAERDPGTYFKQLRFALEDVGFGVFVNVPGLESGFQRELFALAHALFSKPQEWKEALGTSKSYALRGYFRADDIEGSHKVNIFYFLYRS